MIMCASQYVSLLMFGIYRWPQKPEDGRSAAPLELNYRSTSAGMSWVLSPSLKFSGRATNVLSHWTILLGSWEIYSLLFNLQVFIFFSLWLTFFFFSSLECNNIFSYVMQTMFYSSFMSSFVWVYVKGHKYVLVFVLLFVQVCGGQG